MTNLILRRLTPADESAYKEAVSLWDHASGFLFERESRPDLSFPDYIQLLDSYEHEQKIPQVYVPDTSLFCFVDQKIVGRLSIRHRLNDHLLKVGGHIGYGVVPPYRLRGYAKEMLRLALPIAKEIGITRALVTCDDNNIGSIKTIEVNGGKLENVIFIAEGKPLKRRYWIDL